MRMPARVLLATLAGGMFVACKAGPRPFSDDNGPRPSAVQVKFRPLEGTPIVERLTTIRKEGPETPGEVQSVRATLTTTFDRSGEGWILTQQLSDVRAERGGSPVQSPLLELMTRFPIKLRLANDGAFVRLANPEDARTAVRETFDDPQQAAVILRYFTPEAIESQARLEWNGKYGELLGRDVVPGDAWYGLETLPLSSGAELKYVLERKVIEIRAGANGPELVLALSCPASPQAAANSGSMRRLLESSEGPKPEATVACRGEQVLGLDPFLPRSTRLELTASPKDAGGASRTLEMTRNVRTEEGSSQGNASQEAR